LRSSESASTLSGSRTPAKSAFRFTSSTMRGVSPPSERMMWKSWSTSDSPGKSGSPLAISAISVPIAQMSTAFP
jgi:hypothetical protein